jgi:hypothetical protein
MRASVSTSPILRRLAVWIGGAAIACMAGMMRVDARAQTPAAPAPPPPNAVVVTYADGFRAPLRIGQAGCGGWTPKFPRVAAWTPQPNELPVSAINYRCERTAAGVRVAVSVFRGSPHQQEDPIATVLVTPGQNVLVYQLKAVGVEPVTLSLGHIAEAVIAPPKVGVPSPLREIVEVTVISAPPARYRVLLRNRAAKAVRGISIEGAREGQRVIGARRVGREGAMLIDVGGDFALDVNVPVTRPAADGSIGAAPLDRIQITAVVWSDRTLDGGVEGINAMVADFGDRLGLAQVLAVLQRPATPAAAPNARDLRAALGALPIDVTDAMIDDAHAHVPSAIGINQDRVATLLRVSLQGIKKMALDDLAAFESAPPGAGTLEAWVNTTTGRYVRWLERLK